MRFCEEGPVRDSRNSPRKIMRPELYHHQSEWRGDNGCGEMVVVDVGGEEKWGEEMEQGGEQGLNAGWLLLCLLSKCLHLPTFNCSI